MNNPSNSTWAEKKPKAKINNEIFTEDSVDSDDYNESKSEESHKITKAVSFTEDDDSNLIHNGSSSSDSDLKQKSDSNDNEIGNMLKLPYSSNSTEEYNNIFDENMNRKESLDDYENINIVDFLLNFLNYYGLQFDYFEQGLKVLENDSCETYFKAERYNMDCSETISVESIQEPNVDIGKSCYKYDKIRMIFFETLNRIKEYMNDNKNSVLQALNFPSS